MNIDLNEQQNFRLEFHKVKESVNIDLNEEQIFKLEFHKVKKVWT